MNYYKRHIGDYAAATRHLSLLEHGVYSMLLDVYYTSEKSLPLEIRAVQRLVSAKSKDEREAVEVILKEFFKTGVDGWHQERCDEEIHRKQVVSEINQAVGKLGGRPKMTTDSVICDNPNSLRLITKTVSAAEADRNPSHEPVTSNQYSQDTDAGASVAGGLPACPHRRLIESFGKHLPQLPQPKPELWHGKPADDMRARWKWVLTAKRSGGQRYAETADQAFDWFDRYFGHVARSDFLSGRNDKWANCDLGWLMKSGNFAKVVQGNYDNKTGAA